MVSPFAMRRLAQHYENGAQKYADRNWEKGMPFSRYVDSAKRHLLSKLVLALQQKFRKDVLALYLHEVDLLLNEDYAHLTVWES